MFLIGSLIRIPPARRVGISAPCPLPSTPPTPTSLSSAVPPVHRFPFIMILLSDVIDILLLSHRCFDCDSYLNRRMSRSQLARLTDRRVDSHDSQSLCRRQGHSSGSIRVYYGYLYHFPFISHKYCPIARLKFARKSLSMRRPTAPSNATPSNLCAISLSIHRYYCINATL